VAHFDNDDYADLALPSSNVDVLLGRGNGHFSSQWGFPAYPPNSGVSTSAAAAGDLDGDGHSDLVVLNTAAGIMPFLNDGTGWFEEGEVLEDFGAAGGIVLADLNGDDHADIAAALRIGGTIVVALSQGDGTFDEPVSLAAGLLSAIAEEIVAGDATGEGITDLVVARQDGAAVAVFAGHGDGTFEPGVPYLTGLSVLGSQGFTSLAGADFDDDGVLDLAIARDDMAEVTVLANDGSGEFAPSAAFPVSAGPRGLLAADLDGEGGVDLAVASAVSGHVNVLLNPGDGDLALAATYIAGPLPGGLAVADLNNDASPDLVVANELPNDGIAVYTQTSGATVLFNLGDGTFTSAPAHAAGAAPSAMAAADLDVDGHVDLVVANHESDDVSVLLSEDGALGESVEYDVGVEPIAVVLLDADGNGTLDVATANAGSDSISVRLNDGQGALGPEAWFPTGSEPSAMVSGDFNEDGAPDLAVTTLGDARARVLLNLGTGSFDAAVEYETGLEPIALVAADLTGDGVLDLAIANQGSKSVTMLGNVGDGSFEQLGTRDLGPAADVGPTPSSILAEDLSGDDKIDLIVASAESGSVTVLNNEDGWFNGPTGPGAIFVEKGVNSLAAADLDGDGTREVVLASSVGVVFVLGDGADGSLEVSRLRYYASGVLSRAVTPGDFNGDGRLDLAIANPGPEDNVVRILLNTCVEPPMRPPPAVGFKVDLAPSPTCDINLDPALDQLGNPPPDEERASGDPKGTPVVDGADLVTAISCAVAGSPSSGFRLRAKTSTGITLDAPALDGEGVGTASLAFFSAALGEDSAASYGETLSSSTCTIEVIEGDIEPGSVWAHFSCVDMVGDDLSSPSICNATGEILLKNCGPG